MSQTSNFDALLAEIGTMAKGMPKGDDGKIAAAAGDAGVTVNPAPAGGDGTDGEEGEEGGEGGAPMAKSFTLKLEDGTEVVATDGAELIKALGDRVEKNETAVLAALGGLLPMVKALADQVGKLSASPQPRRAVLTVAERPAAAASTATAPAGVSGEEFMAKAMAAQSAGRLTGHQVSMAEQYINMGQQPPADIVRVVLT